MADEFLPKDYNVPTNSDKYMKFVKGENRFRVLCSPILGYEWWIETDDGKRTPKRVPMDKSISISEVDPEELKHFWAMAVWNYTAEKVQILEITQRGIQKTLRALAKDEDWGSPVLKYDIVINRIGEGMETRYEVFPKPARKLDEEIVKLYNDTEIDLTALYRGEDPFSTSSEKIADDAVKAGL